MTQLDSTELYQVRQLIKVLPHVVRLADNHEPLVDLAGKAEILVVIADERLAKELTEAMTKRNWGRRMFFLGVLMAFASAFKEFWPILSGVLR